MPIASNAHRAVQVRYHQVDVFTRQAGHGNPLGVVFDAQDWSTADMQRFAAWTNLVETTFVLPATRAGASYRLRIFTPTREIPFAGHPTLGSAHAALQAGLVCPHDGRLLQECGAGLLPILVEQAPTARPLAPPVAAGDRDLGGLASRVAGDAREGDRGDRDRAANAAGYGQSVDASSDADRRPDDGGPEHGEAPFANTVTRDCHHGGAAPLRTDADQGKPVRSRRTQDELTPPPLLFVQAPPAQVLAIPDAQTPALASLLDGIAQGALAPALVVGGRRWWLTEFSSEAQLRAWRPEHSAIAALAHASDSLGLCAFARVGGTDYQLAVRAFPAGAGIVEDPASGAANALIAAYIAAREPDGPLGRGYRVSQGREIGRDATLVLRIDRGGGVWVGGHTCSVVEGTLRWRIGS